MANLHLLFNNSFLEVWVLSGGHQTNCNINHQSIQRSKAKLNDTHFCVSVFIYFFHATSMWRLLCYWSLRSILKMQISNSPSTFHRTNFVDGAVYKQMMQTSMTSDNGYWFNIFLKAFTRLKSSFYRLIMLADIDLLRKKRKDQNHSSTLSWISN